MVMILPSPQPPAADPARSTHDAFSTPTGNEFDVVAAEVPNGAPTAECLADDHLMGQVRRSESTRPRQEGRPGRSNRYLGC